MKRTAPIPGLPDSSLLDCLFVTGKRGGGKSYSQRLAIERALSKGLRCGWVDSLGVGWGVTVKGDPNDLEKPVGPGYDVVVFGGEHGHMPLSHTAGTALGTMLAKAKFSWVIDLKNFKSKAQRVGFMADFMEALYENCDEQLLLLLDEVDLWAPQIIFDKQGPAPRLLGAVDEIVRRGRIKGLSVWMATQRPAVVSKNIISQAEGMVAFKTVAPQDTEAVMSWIKAHLKKGAYDEWLAQLPALKKGEAIVYLTEPEISIRRQQFPLIDTLDTFKPQKGGKHQSDTLATKPDLEALKQQLGTLEEKLKAEDPAHLRNEVARLTRELAVEKKTKAAPSVVRDDTEVRSVAYNAGWAAYEKQSEEDRALTNKALVQVRQHLDKAMGAIPGFVTAPPARDPSPTQSSQVKTEMPRPFKAVPRPSTFVPDVDLAAAKMMTGPEQKIMKALAKWKGMGFDKPSRAQLATLCDYHPRTPSFTNPLGSLRTTGYIDHGGGDVWFTDAGLATVNVPVIADVEALHAELRDAMDGPQKKIFDVLVQHGTDQITRQELADTVGYHPRTPSFTNPLGALRTREILDYGTGTVFLRPWVFMEQGA